MNGLIEARFRGSRSKFSCLVKSHTAITLVCAICAFGTDQSLHETDLLLYGRSRILECGQGRVRIGYVYATS
jgi:hypothetical protein